jgi:cytidylate kinase
MSIITVSHEAFGAGRAVAERVAAILNYRCISREVLIKASDCYGIAEARFLEVLEQRPRHWWARWLESLRIYRVTLQAALCEFAQEGNVVYHGRAGQECFPGICHVLNVFVKSPAETRIEQIMARRALGEEAAKKYLEQLDRTCTRRIRELFEIDWRDATRYDIVLNTARTTVETAARIIAELSQREEYRPTAESLQAIKDLTITARVEAVLLASSNLHISNLKLETRCGEVHVGGVILAEDIREIAADTIRKIPGVTRVKTYFLITTPDEYLYRDGR